MLDIDDYIIEQSVTKFSIKQNQSYYFQFLAKNRKNKIQYTQIKSEQFQNDAHHLNTQSADLVNPNRSLDLLNNLIAWEYALACPYQNNRRWLFLSLMPISEKF